MGVLGPSEDEKRQSDSHHKNGGTDRVIGKLCARHPPSRTPGSVASLPDMIAGWTVRISLPPCGGGSGWGVSASDRPQGYSVRRPNRSGRVPLDATRHDQIGKGPVGFTERCNG